MPCIIHVLGTLTLILIIVCSIVFLGAFSREFYTMYTMYKETL